MIKTALRLLVLFLLSGCVHPSPWLSLSVQPRTKEIHSLRVKLQPTGKPEFSLQHRRVDHNPQSIELDVPRAWRSGRLNMEVTSLESHGCEVGRGQTVVDIPASARWPVMARKGKRFQSVRGLSPPIRVSVELTTFPARCAVSIASTGEVPLTIAAGGVPQQCPHGTPCELILAPETPVQIRAQIDPAVTSWTGPCEQSHGDTCSFVLKEPGRVAVSFARPVCRSGFCWHNPVPQGNPLFSVWGFGKSDVWAAGAAGTLLHYDGKLWEGVESGTTASLFGLWGAGESDVWACGSEGTLLHFDGQRWASVASGTKEDLRGIFGQSAHSIWAVGTHGALRLGGRG
jgi:hypothetical protein